MDKKEIQKLIKEFSTYRIEVQTLEELTNYENNLIDKFDKAINNRCCCTTFKEEQRRPAPDIEKWMIENGYKICD